MLGFKLLCCLEAWLLSERYTGFCSALRTANASIANQPSRQKGLIIYVGQKKPSMKKLGVDSAFEEYKIRTRVSIPPIPDP
jgi:hypothetical protein